MCGQCVNIYQLVTLNGSLYMKLMNKIYYILKSIPLLVTCEVDLEYPKKLKKHNLHNDKPLCSTNEYLNKPYYFYLFATINDKTKYMIQYTHLAQLLNLRLLKKL